MSRSQTSLLLVRHGQTPWNAAGRWQGHADPALSARGRSQAVELAEALSRELETDWTRIVASDLRRARETARILADALALEVELDARLRELDVGEWAGLTRAEIEARDPDRLRAFESGEPSVRAGGGETRFEIRRRVRDLVCEIAERHAGERLIVVTHLGVIRALLPEAQPGNADRYALVAEEIAARRIDRARRPQEGAL